MKKVMLVSIFSVAIDQIIKLIITYFMSLNSSIIIIKNFFSITYVMNNGAAWSILSGHSWFLILMAILALNLIYIFFIKDKVLNKFEIIVYGLLIGGILGNLIDRILYGKVVDYLDFTIFNYNFPIFNFADIFICVSVFLLIIGIIRGDIDERNKSCTNWLW